VTDFSGKIQAVQRFALGSQLVQDAEIGDTYLYVASIADFLGDGGTLRVNGVVLTYTQSDATTDPPRLLLAAPLAAAIGMGEGVYHEHYSEEKRALVKGTEQGDGVWVRIPRSMEASVPDGIREPDNQETVTYYTNRTGEFEAREILATPSQIGQRYVEGLAQMDADLTELNDVILPGLQDDLAAAEAELTTLTGVTIPALNDRLTDAEADLAGLDMDLGDLGDALDDAVADITTLNTVTIPALDSRLGTNEAWITYWNYTIYPDHEARMTAATTAINTLNTVTIPALDTRLDTAESDINTLNVTTIPGLDSRLDTAEGTLTVLTGTTIPGLDSRLSDAEADLTSAAADIATLDGKFPIGTTDIQNDAITTPKMTANSINGDRITANTLNASKIVAGSITTDRMTANSIDGDRITANTLNASKIIAGSITTDRMTSNTIDGAVITAGTLAANKIVANSITTSQITASGINGDRITANTLAADRIVANSITTTQITSGGINGDRITANTLGADRIVANSISTTQITAAGVNGDRITANTLNADRIVAGSITTDRMTANTIDGDRITANTLNAAKIIAGTITTDRMTANSIDGDRITANTLNASKIIAGSITTTQMTANTINGDRITTNTLNADRIVSNSITASQIASDAIIARHILAGEITTDKLNVNVLQSGFVVTGGLTVSGSISVGTHTWTPSDGLTIPGVANFPGGARQQTVTITGTPTGGTFTLTGNSATTSAIAYNATASSGTTQTVTLLGIPTGGSFTLSSGGVTTTAIAYNASAGTVQTAVRTLGGEFAAATVTGTGPWVITATAAAPALVTASALTGGTTPSAVITHSNVQTAVRALGGVWASATVSGGAGPGTPWVLSSTGGAAPLICNASLTGGTSPAITITQGDITATITASVNAKSLTVQKDFVLLGVTNFIRGTINLASGVTRPTTAPNVYQSWPVVGSHAMGYGSTDYGLTNHLTDSSIFLTAQAFFGGNLVGIRKSDGQYVAVTTTSAISGWAGNFNPIGGITTVGSNYFVLGVHTNGHHYIYKLDSSFQFVSSYDVTALLPPGAGRYALGKDEVGNIMVACTYPSNTIRVLFWTASTLSYNGYRDYGTFTSVGASNISYCGEGNYDFGAGVGNLKDIFAVEGVANFACTTSGDRQGDAYAFSASNGGTVRGMYWDGTRFWSYTGDGTLYKHGTNKQPQTITVSYSWADRVSTGSTHETEETTTPASYIQSARTWINVETPLPPDNGSSNTDAANRVGIYAAAGAGTRVLQTQVGPAGADAGYLLPDDGTGKSVTKCQWETLVTGTSASKVSNEFVGVTGTGGGIFKSQAATTGSGIILNGDGSGQIGRLNFANDGTMSGAGVESFLVPNSSGSNMSVTSTVTDIPGLTRTWTVPAGGGTYLIRFYGWIIPTAGHTVIVACFVDSPWTTPTGGAAVQSGSGNGTVSYEWRVTLAAGSHTVKLRAYTAAAGQTGIIAGGGNSQMVVTRSE
jgi:hypothetical protein